MAALRKALSRYDPLFAQRGFSIRAGQDSGQRFSTGDGRAVIFDRMKTGQLRCFLELGEPPEVEGESPCWETELGKTLDMAVAESWEYLTSVGFQFLDDPEHLTVTAWREQHNLLVRDFRKSVIQVTWPADWSLNQCVIAVKRSIPDYKKLTALQIREKLGSKSSILITDLSLLDAKEIILGIKAEGLTAEVRKS